MADLSDFKRSQIVSARIVDPSEIKINQIFGVSKGTVSKVMNALKKEKKCLQQITRSFGMMNGSLELVP